jgi:ABC-2 type transport system permease protein
MKINIYFKELNDYKKSLFFWSIGIIFLLLSGMAKYQGYAKSGVSITDLFKDLPAGFSAFFGIGSLDLGTAGGFFSIMALYLSVMLGVHAVLLGSRIIAKEEIDKTAEFLFTKPITRRQGFTAKILAAFTIMTVLSVVTAISSVIIVGIFNEGPSINNDILLLMPSIFFIQLIFLTIGISFASIMRNPKRASMFSGALLLATFIISAFVDITDKFDFLKYLSPFKYFDAKTIFIDGEYDISYIVIAIVFVISFLAVSQTAFKRRDFNI